MAWIKSHGVEHVFYTLASTTCPTHNQRLVKNYLFPAQGVRVLVHKTTRLGHLKSSNSLRSLWGCLSAQLTLNNKAGGGKKREWGQGREANLAEASARLAWFSLASGQGSLLRYWVGQVYEVGVATKFHVFTFLC